MMLENYAAVMDVQRLRREEDVATIVSYLYGKDLNQMIKLGNNCQLSIRV